MMAEVIAQEVPESISQAVETTVPLDLGPRPPRLPNRVHVRANERHLSQDVQRKLWALRQEVHALNKALERRNRDVLRLRAEVRLRDRVMRLKGEARNEGRAALIEELSQCAKTDVRVNPVTREDVEAVSARG